MCIRCLVMRSCQCNSIKIHNLIKGWVAGTMVARSSSVSCGCTFETEPSPTSAYACGEVTGCVLAAKRSASVAPEVNLGECTLHSPLQK